MKPTAALNTSLLFIVSISITIASIAGKKMRAVTVFKYDRSRLRHPELVDSVTYTQKLLY